MENKAKLEGGGIAWFGKIPKIDDKNTYFKNTALYGASISSYPIKLGVEIFDKNSSVLIYSSKENSSMAKISANSGNPLQYNIIFYLLDFYDVTVKSITG